jgi:hypothetical protein
MGFFKRFRRRLLCRFGSQKPVGVSTLSGTASSHHHKTTKTPRARDGSLSAPALVTHHHHRSDFEDPSEVGDLLAPEDQFSLEIPIKLPRFKSPVTGSRSSKGGDQDTTASSVSTITWHTGEFGAPAPLTRKGYLDSDELGWCGFGSPPAKQERAFSNSKETAIANAQQDRSFPSFLQWFFGCGELEDEQRSTEKTIATYHRRVSTMRSARPLLDSEYDDEATGSYFVNTSVMALDDRSKGSRRFSRVMNRARSIPRMRSQRRRRSTSRRGDRKVSDRQHVEALQLYSIRA